jgi:hypothetical protein
MPARGKKQASAGNVNQNASAANDTAMPDAQILTEAPPTQGTDQDMNMTGLEQNLPKNNDKAPGKKGKSAPKKKQYKSSERVTPTPPSSRDSSLDVPILQSHLLGGLFLAPTLGTTGTSYGVIGTPGTTLPAPPATGTSLGSLEPPETPTPARPAPADRPRRAVPAGTFKNVYAELDSSSDDEQAIQLPLDPEEEERALEWDDRKGQARAKRTYQPAKKLAHFLKMSEADLKSILEEVPLKRIYQDHVDNYTNPRRAQSAGKPSSRQNEANFSTIFRPYVQNKSRYLNSEAEDLEPSEWPSYTLARLWKRYCLREAGFLFSSGLSEMMQIERMWFLLKHLEFRDAPSRNKDERKKKRFTGANIRNMPATPARPAATVPKSGRIRQQMVQKPRDEPETPAHRGLEYLNELADSGEFVPSSVREPKKTKFEIDLESQLDEPEPAFVGLDPHEASRNGGRDSTDRAGPRQSQISAQPVPIAVESLPLEAFDQAGG